MDFLRKIAGTDPLPAGGAAAAYTLGLAIGLINKVVPLGIYRHADRPDIEKTLLTAKKELEGLLKAVEKLMAEDAENYMRFDRSRRLKDKTRLQIDFSATIEVSMKLLEKSDAAFEWIRRIHTLIPRQMTPHLLVACELIMGAINGTFHVARANLNSIRAPEKRDSYLNRLNTLQRDYQGKYVAAINSLTQTA